MGESSEKPKEIEARPGDHGPLSHVDAQGAASMVNVADKPVSRRTAVALAELSMNEITAQAVQHNTLRKGDVLHVARVAGIQAAKRTDELIPLCHSLPLDEVCVSFKWIAAGRLQIEATATATARTGVEMEALMAASVAALTVYDMCKSSDRGLTIEQVRLSSKTGGVTGDYHRDQG